MSLIHCQSSQVKSCSFCPNEADKLILRLLNKNKNTYIYLSLSLSVYICIYICLYISPYIFVLLRRHNIEHTLQALDPVSKCDQLQRIGSLLL